MPTFTTAHTLCASRDGLRKSGFINAVPAKTEIFLRGLLLRGKANLGKSYWDTKRKVGVTMHYSEITKLQFGKKMPYIALYVSGFLELLLLDYL